MSGCRIGRVRLKAGGEVRLLSAKTDTTSEMVSQARAITETFKDEMDGYLIVGWDKAALYQIAYRTGDGAIKPALMPSWIKDLTLRQVTENGTIEEIQSWD